MESNGRSNWERRPEPETVASRLVWSIGYFANEDYFLPVFSATGMPHLKRGNSFVEPDGSIRNVRLKRYSKDEKKVGIWEWRKNPFTDTRELNGLRVMMAVINNWDLKDDNNAVYEEKGSDGTQLRVSGKRFGIKLWYYELHSER